ncbi:MAG: heme-binding domain-containing protein [Anaerolineaceae bacterium]
MQKKRSGWRTVLYVIAGAIILFGLIQLIPFGKNHVNPPVVQEPNWDSPETRSLAKTACFDCHSNETNYPWYASVAPASWLLQLDIDEGRRNMNFSDWGNYSLSATEIAKVVQDGKMPPFQYTIIHKNANLDQTQRDQLIQGLEASLK